MEKWEPSIGGNLNCCSHSGRRYGGFKKKLKTELSYDPVIPFLGIYLGEKHTNSKRYMHLNVHSSIIYNWQNMLAI